MHKYRISLDTVTDIANFVLVTSKIKSDVWVTSGRMCVSGKSFLGLAHAQEFDEIYCECDEDIYRLIQDFVVNE